MKKIITPLLLIFCVIELNAQIYTPTGTIQGVSGSNNVGIGTSTPSTKLDVIGTVKIQSSNSNYDENLRLLPSLSSDYSSIALGAVNGNSGTGTGQWTLVRYPAMNNFMFSLRYNTTDYFNVLTNGNVGLGTMNPSSKLSVLGGLSKLTLTGIDGTFDNLIKYGHRSDLESQTSYSNRWHGIDATITAGNASDNKLKFRLYAGSSANLEPADVMTLVGNGNVGIGIVNPTNKLDVNGTIHSKEVKVDMNGWSDFVFKKDYTLPTLQEVEKHIAEKGHLGNIPSEEEVLKNGINLGEMNSKLLQKIEELTLYVIEQNKKLQNQEKEIIKLNEDNADLVEIRKRLNKIESKL